MSRDESDWTSGPSGRAVDGTSGNSGWEAQGTADGHHQLDAVSLSSALSAHIEPPVDYKAENVALRARVRALEEELASRRDGAPGSAAASATAPLAWGVTRGPAVIHWRLEGTVTRWNEGAAHIFGWSAAEAVGRRLSELVAADPVTRRAAQSFDHDRSENLFATTTSEGRTREGAVITCRWTYAVLREGQGDAREIAAIVDEASDPRQREQLLEERYQLLLQLVDNSPSTIFVKDAEGRYVFLNRYYARTLGRHIVEVLGKTDHEVNAVIPGFAEQIGAKEREVLTSGRVMQYDEVAYIDGVPHHFFAVKFPVHDELGEPVGVGGIVTEVTALKRAEAERAALQEKIIAAQQEALRELSTPLIPLADGVLAMPLVGTVDDARAAQIMEMLLAGISSQRAHTAILDITGVRAIDTHVADALTRTARAAQLLGTRVVLTGIRPEVARSLVELGADLSGIITLGTLQSGIAHALRHTERPRSAR
ncbi:anti-anti-sigma factor [Sorangium cellulosum]|uniref:Anti-anti-sigma factor n=1 Tax=Sorangium cellulosum TaxID=56 RepID=A0A2L0FBA8_SORCE|nr:PAS domain-containing protein [Sorangium cellulosum]AUX48762.1 anti-anti-sigma factor [Sorangium cellulosum]